MIGILIFLFVLFWGFVSFIALLHAIQSQQQNDNAERAYWQSVARAQKKQK